MSGYQPIVLVADETRVSNADGKPNIVWTDAFGDFAASTGIRLFINVLSVTRSAAVRVFAQWSTDKRTWVDFLYSIDGIATGVGSGQQLSIDYAAMFAEFAPWVRFGIQVIGDVGGALQGDARLTATVSPLFSDAIFCNPILKSGYTMRTSTTPVFIADSSHVVSAFKRGVILCKVNGLAGGNAYVTATGSENGTDFAALGGFVTVPANGLYAIPVDSLAKYVGVGYYTAGGASATLESATIELKQW